MSNGCRLAGEYDGRHSNNEKSIPVKKHEVPSSGGIRDRGGRMRSKKVCVLNTEEYRQLLKYIREWNTGPKLCHIARYSGFQSQLEDVGRLKFQDVNQGSVQISEWMRHKLPPQDFQERVRRCAIPSTVLAAYAPNVAPYMFEAPKNKAPTKRAATNTKVTTTEIWDEYEVIEMSGDSDFEALVAPPEKKKKGGRKLAVANPSATTVKKSRGFRPKKSLARLASLSLMNCLAKADV
ncbi:hypothetical protein Tco_0756634 [Tanacetum coccineum]